MADKENDDKPKGELCHICICCAENGYTIECTYEAEKTLSQRAGWIGNMPGEQKKYVEKTKDGLIKTLKEIL